MQGGSTGDGSDWHAEPGQIGRGQSILAVVGKHSQLVVNFLWERQPV